MTRILYTCVRSGTLVGSRMLWNTEIARPSGNKGEGCEDLRWRSLKASPTTCICLGPIFHSASVRKCIRSRQMRRRQPNSAPAMRHIFSMCSCAAAVIRSQYIGVQEFEIRFGLLWQEQTNTNLTAFVFLIVYFLAIPKSSKYIVLALSFKPTEKFCGFTSLWMYPISWRSEIASIVCSPTFVEVP